MTDTLNTNVVSAEHALQALRTAVNEAQRDIMYPLTCLAAATNIVIQKRRDCGPTVANKTINEMFKGETKRSTGFACSRLGALLVKHLREKSPLTCLAVEEADTPEQAQSEVQAYCVKTFGDEFVKMERVIDPAKNEKGKKALAQPSETLGLNYSLRTPLPAPKGAMGIPKPQGVREVIGLALAEMDPKGQIEFLQGLINEIRKTKDLPEDEEVTSIAAPKEAKAKVAKG